MKTSLFLLLSCIRRGCQWQVLEIMLLDGAVGVIPMWCQAFLEIYEMLVEEEENR